MRTEFCVFCGSRENLEHHHVLPRVIGGGDEEENMITCCSLCHGKLHSVNRTPNLGELTKLGLQKAKARGTKLGSPQNLTKKVQELGRSIANEKSKKRAIEKATKLAPTILKMKLEGKSLNKIADQLNKDGVPTVSGIGSWNASMVRRVVNYV